jgi:hypothetical protein
LFEKVCKDKITLNVLEKELQVKLWKKKYDFSKANDNVCQIKKWLCKTQLRTIFFSWFRNIIGPSPVSQTTTFVDPCNELALHPFFSASKEFVDCDATLS